MLLEDKKEFTLEQDLEDWVIDKCQGWRNHFESNYADKFDEYYRLWRGQWAAEDRTRDSERSRIISPALQQAVESSVAELEEATFGRGKWFDIEDDVADNEKRDIALLRETLYKDFKKNKVRKSVAECLINAAVFGTGVAEVVLEEEKEFQPATQPVMGGELQAVGVNIVDKTCVKLRPVMPQNFLIDPLASSVEDALGCAVDEFVPMHLVEQLQEAGVYRDVYVGEAASDFDIEPDKDLAVYEDDKVRLTKYYGLVPRHLLKAAQQEDESEEVEELVADDEEETYYVEAVVIIANDGTLLKAEANPYMMGDRPIVAFPWDVVPSRFWGRGVCEKGYNSQKALDAEIRARIDALALTIHPMMAIDATRMPRGSRPEVRAGKTILTNGSPREVLQPLNFGNVSQVTFAQANELQKMVQTATGAIDSAGISGSINGDATAAGISMSLGAIIKRHKRTLINFQESFLIPFVTKAAHRYMQFNPERYPVADYKFHTSSSLGIIAREYEVTQLVQLLQTMQPDSPMYSQLIMSIVDNMNLANREELVAALQQANQPNPEAQQAQQAMQQAQVEFQKSQTAALQGQAIESQARAQKLATEAQAVPQELEIDRIKAVTANLKAGDADDKEFQKRLKISEQLLKEREVSVKEGQGKANDNTTPVQQGTGGNQPVVSAPEPTLEGIGSRGPRPQGIPQGEA
ncbi:portal protein [Planctomycetota bacterium]|nr:portal protein [Planctomycetota bacterium]